MDFTRRTRSSAAAAACLAVVTAAAAVAGCGGSGDSTATAASSSSASADSASLPQGTESVQLDPADFTTKIDNPYLPFAPGDRWIYRGTSADGPPQRIVVKVLPQTKVVADGIEGAVVHDVAYEHGRLIENTYDWYAQDSAGNVWYLGEDTKAYDPGSSKPDTSGSFEAGVDGAQAGVVMPADPTQGMTYRQEYYAGEARDEAEVLGTGQQAEVTAGHFPDALLTAESSPLEPKIEELKFYARGVGNVAAISVSGETDREELLRYEPASGKTIP